MFFKNKKAEAAAWTLVAMVAIVAVVGMVFMSTGKLGTSGVTGAATSAQGTCVILPNTNAPDTITLGQGLVNADSVCDAATKGCSYCIGYCSVFRKTNDKYGCPTCTPTEAAEISCADGIDNDCDNLIDETDPNCSPECLQLDFCFGFESAGIPYNDASNLCGNMDGTTCDALTCTNAVATCCSSGTCN